MKAVISVVIIALIQKTERVEKGIMSFELFERILQQLADLNYSQKISYHFYGEPLINPHLNFYVRRTKEVLPNCFIEILSNGVFLDYNRFCELRILGVDRFTVTKHKPLKKIAFDETYARLSEAEKTSVHYQESEDLFLTNRGGLVGVGAYEAKQVASRPCFIPSTSLVISLLGNVIGCYEDYHQKNIMGNVNERHLKDIWFDGRYDSFRADLKRSAIERSMMCAINAIITR